LSEAFRPWSAYLTPLLLMKLYEFVACALLGAALIYLTPGVYYAESDVFGSAWGGVIFAGLFFAFTAYPIVSVVLLLILVALRVRSKLILAFAAGIFLLSYTAYFESMVRASSPASFWITWLVMGLITFLLALWLLPREKTRIEP